jgi:hypothetical protein
MRAPRTLISLATVALLLGGCDKLLTPALTPNPSAPIKQTQQKQNNSVGLSRTSFGDFFSKTSRPKTVKVKSYTRKDGTFVRSHYRSSPRRSRSR